VARSAFFTTVLDVVRISVTNGIMSSWAEGITLDRGMSGG
jgi:hypothetical protein